MRNIGLETDDSGQGKGFEMLEYFNYYWGYLTAEELHQVAGKSPKLRRLVLLASSISGLERLSSEVVEELDIISEELLIPSDGFANTFRKWRSTLRTLKITLTESTDYYYGDALRQLVDEHSDPPIRSVELRRGKLSFNDLMHFIRYAENLKHLNVVSVGGLPTVFRKNYTPEHLTCLRKLLVSFKS